MTGPYRERAVPQARPAGLLLGVVIALTISACGGDGGGDSGDGRSVGGASEQRIVHVITESFTSGDPDKCTRFDTQRALEQGNGFKGEAAIRVCERFVDANAADSVEVSNVSVEGRTASVEVAVSGERARRSDRCDGLGGPGRSLDGRSIGKLRVL